MLGDLLCQLGFIFSSWFDPAMPLVEIRFAARLGGLAFGLALAVRPAGSLEAPRARVGPEDPFCAAVRKDLRVPLRVEGAARTMRGVPPPWL